MSSRSPLAPYTSDGSPVLGYRQPTAAYQPAPSSSPAATPALSTASKNPHDHLFPPPASPLQHAKDKEAGLHVSGGSPQGRRGRRARLAVPRPSWEGAWKYGWMVGPPVLYLLGIVFLAIAIWQGDRSYGSAIEVGGTGRIDFILLNACSVTSDTAVRECTPRSLNANFVPALIRVSPTLPGFSVLQLPFRSSQTPAIFLSALVCLLLSLLVFLPVWTVYHFPSAPLPRGLLRIVRYYPSYFYQLAAVLSGAAFTVSLTIGIGYELYMLTFGQVFQNWVALGVYEGMGTSEWVFEVGDAFDYVYTAVAFQALLTISTVCSLHNGFDETIEYQDIQGSDSYRA